MSDWNWGKLSWVVAINAAVFFFAVSLHLPGGDDLRSMYIYYARGCLTECQVFVPFYGYWLLWPLGLIPPSIVWPVWTVITIAICLFICYKNDINPAIFVLSFPFFGQVYLGQVDALVASGLALLLSPRLSPYLRGFGLLLALLKPPLTILIIGYVLITDSDRFRVALIPLIVFVASLINWGIDWPLIWFEYARREIPPHLWRQSSLMIFPYGLVSLALVPFAKNKAEALMLVSALATPWYSSYSYIVFMLFNRQAAVLPLSWAFVLFAPFMGEQAMAMEWILPLGLLLRMVYQDVTLKNWGIDKPAPKIAP